jgi:hypothetical protein
MKKIIQVMSVLILLFAFTVSVACAQTHRKWSHRKKDAVIGAGGGAVIGGVVSHNHAKGAVIGGVLGGGAGYLHGRHKDKQNGTLAK